MVIHILMRFIIVFIRGLFICKSVGQIIFTLSKEMKTTEKSCINKLVECFQSILFNFWYINVSVYV